MTKAIILTGSLILTYWISIGFTKEYPVIKEQINIPADTLDIFTDTIEIYAGRFDTVPESAPKSATLKMSETDKSFNKKYSKIGLPKDREWLTSDEWKGRHLSGKQLKNFKLWRKEHIKNFIEYIALAAQEERATYPDILPSIVISQSILESAYGKSRLSVEGNNLFGMKYRGSDGNFLVMHDDDPDDRFTIYKSKWYSLRAHSKLLMKKYRNRFKGAPTVDKWVYALCSGSNNEESKKAVDNGEYVYASSCYKHCYQCMLKNIIKKYNLEKYD